MIAYRTQHRTPRRGRHARAAAMVTVAATLAVVSADIAPIGARVQAQTAAKGQASAAAASSSAVAVMKGYQVFRTFQDRFTFQYPAKDWLVVSGGGASMVSLTQKKQEATITIEFQPLQLELAPAEIDANFAQIESEPVALHQPTATGLKSQVADSEGRRIIVIDFTRRGALGPEQVRQYSVPVGKQLYRIVCAAPAAQFAKYENVFAVAVKTFAINADAPPPASAPKS